MSDIAVIGAGFDLDGGVSGHVREMLERADVVFTILSEPHATQFLRGICVRDLRYVLPSLRVDRDRIDNYIEIARYVVEAAEQGLAACYLTYGNPAIFDRIAHLIIESAATKRLTWTSPPAQSAIDAIFSFLGMDVAPALQVFDCTWMVERRITPCIEATLVLMQPAVFNASRIVDVTRRGASMLCALTDYLLQFYSSDHPISFVRAPLARSDAGYCRSTDLYLLHVGPAEDLLSTSIVIRPRATPPEERPKGAVDAR